MTVTLESTRFNPLGRFNNAAEWVRALGGVPLERIIFNPWPGTATEADLLRFVEHDKRLCELIDGTLVEKPVGFIEAIIAMNLGTDLNIYVRPRDLGLVSGPDSTLRMSNGRIRLPDVSFIAKSRLPGGFAPREAIPTLAPDLAVEVLSAANTVEEIDEKLREYFASGTRLAWVIDPPTRTVAVYHRPDRVTHVLDQAAHLDGDEVVPGFKLPVADLFRNLPSVES